MQRKICGSRNEKIRELSLKKGKNNKENCLGEENVKIYVTGIQL